MSKKNIYDQAYNSCTKKGLIQSKCAKFLKLDFELKLKKCRTSKCKTFYKNKLKSLKRKSKRSSRRNLKRSSSKSKKKIKRSIKTKKDGFVVEFPVKPYNTCYVWKGF